MIFLTVDFETYYDKSYTLRKGKVPTSLYVQDERFETLSVAIKTPDMRRPRFYGGPKKVKALFEELKKIQHKIIFCAHHAQFDGYIAELHYDFHPKFYVCTLSMARQLHGQDMPSDLDTISKHYGKQPKGEMPDIKGLHWKELSFELRRELETYNNQDVVATEHIAQEMLKVFPKSELKIVDMTVKAFVRPMLQVNRSKANAVLQEEKDAKAAMVKATGATADQLRSNDQFAALLEERGYEVPTKWSEAQQKLVPCLAQADLPFQAMRDSEDEELAGLIAARIALKSSLNESRAKAFLARAKHPLPIYLNAYGAHTMRWSGGDKMNAQNLPRDGRLRECIEAPPGYMLVVVDAAQIEARDNATFSEQWDLVESFAQGVDTYAKFASKIYGFEVNKKDHFLERFVGKTSILGLGYQMGAPKYQLTLQTGMMGPPVDIDLETAQRVVTTYRAEHQAIVRTWRELQSRIPFLLSTCNREEEFRGLIIRPGGTVVMPNGLELHYPGANYTIGAYDNAEFYYEPYSTKYKKRIKEKLYGGRFLENIIQCRSRIMTAEHALKLSQYYRVVLLVHDEIVMCVPKHKAERCLRDALEIMSIPPRWNEKCPLAAEGDISKHYIKPE